MSSTKKRLTHLETVGLIKLAQTHPELEFMFRHALVQEVAYNSLLIEDRKKLHLQVGGVIEQTYPNRLEEFAPVLGHHFAVAGDDQRALKYYTLAGDVAFGVYANAEAIDHYAHALKVAKRGEGDIEQLTHLYTRRGRALELSAKFEQALNNYEEMEGLAQEWDDKTMELASLMARATIHVTANVAAVPAKGQILLEQARILANELGDHAAEAKILWNLLLLNVMMAGNIAERTEYGEQALALARELDLREQMAFILHDLWFCYASIDHWAKVMAALDEGRELWRELGNQPMLAENLTRTYLANLILGDYEQAITYSNEALHLGQISNNIDQQVLSQSMIGFVHLEQGHPDKAIKVMEETIALGETIGNVTALIGTRADLGWAYGMLGAVDRGLAVANLAQATAKEKFPLLRPWALVTMVWLHILKQNLAEAEAVLADLGNPHDLKHTIGFIPSVWIGAAVAEGQLALAKRDFGGVVRAMDNLLADLNNSGSLYLYPDAFYLKGLALLGLGRTVEARETLVQARTEAEALGSRRALWPILISLGDIEQQLGHETETIALHQQAQEIVEYIADHIKEPELRVSFLNLPRVRAVLKK